MSRLRAPFRSLDPVAACGAIIVIALVVAIPLALAFCSADSLGADEAGVGSGMGDVLAAALSSLDRDLHGAGPLPPPTRTDLEAFTASPDAATSITGAACVRSALPPRGSRLHRPGEVLAGTTNLGHQLLL